MEDVSAPAIDPGVAELTADHFSESLPESLATTQEPSTGVAEPRPEASQAQPGTEGSAPAPTQPTGQTLEIQGRNYTWDEINANPELRQAVLTRAMQTAHFQREVETARQQALMAQQQSAIAAQQMAQRANQPQQQQPANGGFPIPDQIKAEYAVAVKRAVEMGHVEEEVAAAYPAFTANMMRAYDRLEDARTAVGIIAERLNAMESGSTQQNVLREIDSNIANLSATGEHFAGLADPAHRGEFFNYLVSINPQVGLLRDPNFIASQYVAYKKDEVLASVAEARKAQAVAAAAGQRKRQLAQGVGTGTRPGTLQPDNGQGFFDADLAGDFQHIFKR